MSKDDQTAEGTPESDSFAYSGSWWSEFPAQCGHRFCRNVVRVSASRRHRPGGGGRNRNQDVLR